MAVMEERSARLNEEFGGLRVRVRGLVEGALATLPLVDGLAPARLDELRDALFHTEHPYLLVFVGPFSAGKSSLINALLQQDVDVPAAAEGPLAVGPVPTTDRIAILRWGSESERRSEGEALDGVYYCAPILQRVSFVDTPGLGSVFAEQEKITRRFLHRSDAVFWVMMARQALAAESLEPLRALREFGKKIILLLNQADTLSEEERQIVLDFVREQSPARLGWQPPVWLVSAKEGLAARGETDAEDAARHWQASGLDTVVDFIAERLGDRARMQQKLSTPLLIVQRAIIEGQTALAANQAHWDELGRAVSNLAGQVEASRAQGQLAVAGAQQGIVTASRVVQETVVSAWVTRFGGRRIPRLLARGLLSLLGLGWLARRNNAEKTLLPTNLLAAVGGWPEAIEQLAGRLEARDWQDIGDLVTAAQQAVDQLPEVARARLVGDLVAPSRYDRKALAETRLSLRQRADAETEREETNLAANAHRLLIGVAVFQLLILLLAAGTVVGRALLAEWRPEAPLYALAGLAAGFIASALWLPISARWHAARFVRRWRLAQAEALDLLVEGAERQLEYGLRLRRDVLLPLTRLWETHLASQEEQRAALHELATEISALEGAIHEWGLPTLRERLGFGRAEATAESTSAEDETEPPAQQGASDG